MKSGKYFNCYKNMKNIIEKSEERYKYLFENSNTINILIGVDGRIIEVNKSAVKLLGYTKGEIIGKNALQFIVDEHRKKASDDLNKIFKNEYTSAIELNIKAKKGVMTLLFAEGHAPLFEKGKLEGTLLSAIDITGQKIIENKLAESERKYNFI